MPDRKIKIVSNIKILLLKYRKVALSSNLNLRRGRLYRLDGKSVVVITRWSVDFYVMSLILGSTDGLLPTAWAREGQEENCTLARCTALQHRFFVSKQTKGWKDERNELYRTSYFLSDKPKSKTDILKWLTQNTKYLYYVCTPWHTICFIFIRKKLLRGEYALGFLHLIHLYFCSFYNKFKVKNQLWTINRSTSNHISNIMETCVTFSPSSIDDSFQHPVPLFKKFFKGNYSLQGKLCGTFHNAAEMREVISIWKSS